MVRNGSGLRSALELDDRRVCVERGTAAELNAADFFIASELRYRPVYFDDQAAAFAGYGAGDCDALTADRAVLAARRSDLEEPDAHVILAELISNEPLGLERGINALWSDGGLIHAPPVR